MTMTEDLDAFLDTGEFAVEATHGGNTFNVIFDRAYLESLGIASSNPIIMGKASDLGSVADDDPITVDGTDYVIAEVPQPDGTGMVLVQLHEAD